MLPQQLQDSSMSLLGDSLAESSAFGYTGAGANAADQSRHMNAAHPHPHDFAATDGPWPSDGFEDDADAEAAAAGFADRAEMARFREVRQMYDRMDAAGLFTLGSECVVDLLRCCQSTISAHTAAPAPVAPAAAAAQPKPLSAPPAPPAAPNHYQDRTLVNTATKLSLVIVQQYYLEIHNARAFNFDDADFLSKVDEEALHAIRLATVIFQANMCNWTTLDIARTALSATVLRPSNYFLCINALQCLQSCGGRMGSREEEGCECQPTRHATPSKGSALCVCVRNLAESARSARRLAAGVSG